MDIGCADNKIKPEAIGIDGRSLIGVDIILNKNTDIYNLRHLYPILIDSDCVFSSHCLEHLLDDYSALIGWSFLIKKDGYLVLYLPDGNFYNSKENEEHFRDYTHDSFMFFFKRAFCGEAHDYEGNYYPPIFRVVESGLDVGPDKYSFYLVAQKL